LHVVAALDRTTIDLIDISGGTYFPGAKAASDMPGRGPYFLEFAKRARSVTSTPLMLTGGFKTREQAEGAVASGAVDVVGLARALVLEPDLADLWKAGKNLAPEFPRFANAPEGGVTAWYTMRMTEIAADRQSQDYSGLDAAIRAYEMRDEERTKIWLRHFAGHAARHA
jgi:2,4-dienoyl-CoA reductase-like NADH-dependent reductase (Old Yellow Enzyme family)